MTGEPKRVGPPGGRVCEACGMTRWEGKQITGWVEEAEREVIGLRARVGVLEAALREIADDWDDECPQVAERARAVLASSSVPCPECEGTGKVVNPNPMSDAAFVTCSSCGGSGRVPTTTEETT